MTESHTETSDVTPEVDAEITATAGPILKEARLAKNMSLSDVATRLHLRPAIVEDIERDCFDNIASPIYVKGYVKNFARIVGADEALIKACIYAQLPSEEKPAMQSFSRKTTIKARDSRLMLVTWLIAFVLVALMVLWWVQKSNTDTTLDFSKPSVEEVAASDPSASVADDVDVLLATSADSLAPGITAEELSPTPSAPEQAPVSQDTGADDTATAQPEPAAPAVEVSPSAPPSDAETVSNQAGELTLDLSADCWMKIIDANGKTLVNGVKTAGAQLKLSGVAPFKVIIGAPKAVTMTFNGEPVSLAAYQDKVARFTLPSPMSE
ncbi:RodZ domain-containing protein [Shewanella sp. NIFS-20-20]|uniref:RodZ domain-containing protein n=1 Tax=Shewanella sp. NIFS-20-20 TaxID=2853806 RepID=UPI001C480DA2|nr:RodZ domain-containing protein [Shewanella sp. NIFS-20-20]MBV7317120.1 DUF4115 domain-containing protein [Shewanella sp. NIFS-20-20]